MIQYREAINIIKKVSLKLNSESISILNSINRVSDSDIRSSSISPPHNNTAFDGFAIIAKETKGISIKNPKKFKIIKTIAAGDNPKIKNYPTTNILFETGIRIKKLKLIKSIENYYYSKLKLFA